MKALFFTFILSIITISASAGWQPESFSKLSDYEKKIVNSLDSLNQKNLTFVQLLLDSGKYKGCGVGTALRGDKLYFSLIDRETNQHHRYVLKAGEALINENEFDVQGMSVHVLVFDKLDLPDRNASETLFMFFYLTPDGSIVGLTVDSKKNRKQGIPVISNIIGTTEPGYNFKCHAR